MPMLDGSASITGVSGGGGGTRACLGLRLGAPALVVTVLVVANLTVSDLAVSDLAVEALADEELTVADLLDEDLSEFVSTDLVVTNLVFSAFFGAAEGCACSVFISGLSFSGIGLRT